MPKRHWKNLVVTDHFESELERAYTLGRANLTTREATRSAVTAGQHPRHRRFEVVAADLVGRDPAELLERVDVPFQQRFLALGSERLLGPSGELDRPRLQGPA